MCEHFGVNAWEVIASANTGYARNNIPIPGYVGGASVVGSQESGMSDYESTLAGDNLFIVREGHLLTPPLSACQSCRRLSSRDS